MIARGFALLALSSASVSACAAREDVVVRLEAPVPGRTSIGA
jgi:hypothetical protein